MNFRFNVARPRARLPQIRAPTGPRRSTLEKCILREGLEIFSLPPPRFDYWLPRDPVVGIKRGMPAPIDDFAAQSCHLEARL